MALPFYLAMTAAEFRTSGPLPAHMAWMACHFSPYGTGLSNLPPALPQDSALIINDRTPFFHHSIPRITHQICQLSDQQPVSCLLLDLQRPNQPEYKELAVQLSQSLPCPVGISAGYAEGLELPVFVPPIPVDQTLEAYLSPYRGREIWMEMSFSPTRFAVDFDGTQITFDQYHPQNGFSDPALCCHYRLASAQIPLFSVWRTWDDLRALAEKAVVFGTTRCFGLYQELEEKKQEDIPPA